MPVATHRQRCGANRAAEVESKNLIARIAPELQRHQRQQDRLARAGRADDKGVADIADMKRETERCRAVGLAKNSGGAPKCSSRAGPAQTADNGIMCARFSVETGGCRTLA